MQEYLSHISVINYEKVYSIVQEHIINSLKFAPRINKALIVEQSPEKQPIFPMMVEG